MRMSAWSILPVTQVLSISFRNALFLLRLRWNLCSHVGRRSVNTVFIWSMKCGRRNKTYAHQHVLATCTRFYARISADCWSPLHAALASQSDVDMETTLQNTAKFCDHVLLYISTLTELWRRLTGTGHGGRCDCCWQNTDRWMTTVLHHHFAWACALWKH